MPSMRNPRFPYLIFQSLDVSNKTGFCRLQADCLSIEYAALVHVFTRILADAGPSLAVFYLSLGFSELLFHGRRSRKGECIPLSAVQL